jgi:hypothetical protein
VPSDLPPPLPLPPGSELVAHWARSRRLAYQGHPDETWFRRWEPYDTMVAPQHYFNACTWTAPAGHVVIVEPWTAPADMDPLERTLLGFATHRELYRRAAMRVGDPFLTRVAFLESPPPPRVTVGDKLWDEHATTFAASSSEAAVAFHRRLRRLLAGWGFVGHLELRPGGLCVHYDGIRPEPEQYDRMLRVVTEIVGAAIDYPKSR